MKKIAVLLADGFEEIEALTVVDVLRRGNMECTMFSINKLQVSGAHKIVVEADKLLDIDEINNYDMLVLPGGMPGTLNLKNDIRVINLVKKFNEDKKLIGAICAAPIVLEEAGVIENKNITLYPSWEKEIKSAKCLVAPVIVDNNIITSRGAGTALAFSYEILSVLGYEETEEMKKSMIYDLISKN